MPCMGPSKDYAYKRSEEAYEEIVALLKEKYQVQRPMFLRKVMIEKRWQEEWDQEAENLKKSLAELFWLSDAANW